jgi:hypothetical protein
MGQAVQAALRRSTVRELALRILGHSTPILSDTGRAASALHAWVRRNIRYVQDPIEIETVQTPEATLELRAGDCDDHAVLMVALAGAIGIPGRFKVVGFSNANLQHVYPELLIDGAWLPADTTSQSSFGQPMGRFPATKVYNFQGGVMPALASRLAAPVSTATVTRSVYQAMLQTISNAWHTGRINHSDLMALRVKTKQVRASNPALADLMDKALSDYQAHVKNRRSGKPEGLSGLGSLGLFDDIISAAKGAYSLVTGGSDASKDQFGNPKGEAASYGFSEAEWAAVGSARKQTRERGFPTREAIVNSGKAATLEQAAYYLDNLAISWVSGGKYVNPMYVPAGPYRDAATKMTPTAQSGSSGGSLFTLNVPENMIHATVESSAMQAGVGEFLSNPMVLIVGGLAAALLLPKLLKGGRR